MLLVVSVVSLLIGLGDFVLAGNGELALAERMTGTSWTEMKESDPRVVNLEDLLSRILGSWLIGFSILDIGISVGAYRKGKSGLGTRSGHCPSPMHSFSSPSFREQGGRQPYASRTVLRARAFRPFNANASPAYTELLPQIGTWPRIEKKTSAS